MIREAPSCVSRARARKEVGFPDCGLKAARNVARSSPSRWPPPESRKRLKAALALLEAGEAEALIFTKVDRQCNSLVMLAISTRE